MTRVPSDKSSIYETVTSKILERIEQGAGTYRAPWHVPGGLRPGLPINAVTHAEYRGINILSLWIDTMVSGYPRHLWASYRQWQQIGAQVRKGERGSLVVFYRPLEIEEAEAEDKDRRHRLRFVAKASHVFNAAQVDNYELDEPEPATPFQGSRDAEAFVAALKARVEHGYSFARYRIDTDTIEMPHREWFVPSQSGSAEESYYAVLLHELTHWSGAAHRLNRTFGKRFGDDAYAFEELVAELGAAFMCAMFGISSEPRDDHAAYVDHWLRVLKRDPKAIFTAASKAEEAFEHLAYLAIRPDSA